MSESIDYAFKSYVLREHEDLFNKYLATEKFEYAKTQTFKFIDEYGELQEVKHPSYIYHSKKGTLDYSQLSNYVVENNLSKEFKEVKKISKARNNRVYRLRSRVASILSNGASLFLTITFNDASLSSTTDKQRRRYVREFLSSYHCSYVGNVDYGKKNHREHYHALIGIDKVSCKDWRYGTLDFEKVRLSSRTDTKLSKYIAKLTNHAIKETTKRCALIYSRG